VGTAGSGAGVLLVLPPLGFSSLGLGISFGGVVPVPGVVITGGALMTAAEAHGSQHTLACFFEPQRDFKVSKRFGRFATLPQQDGAGWHAGAHGAGAHAGAHGAGAQQSCECDFFPNPPMRDLNRSKRPGLELPQQLLTGAPQLLHPAPLTTTGAAGGGGGGTGSAPASAAVDMISNAAFTAATLLRAVDAEQGHNSSLASS
jgi:hypothetical protein